MPGQCNCNTGYSGSLCQNDNDVCSHQAPCTNKGTCANDGANAYVCTCPALFTGTNCEVEVDLCEPSPCQNGATCQVSKEEIQWNFNAMHYLEKTQRALNTDLPLLILM